MRNEIIRQYEDRNIIIYKRIGRIEKNISLYFANGKGIDKNNLYLEFRDIRGIKAFIKSLKKMG